MEIETRVKYFRAKIIAEGSAENRGLERSKAILFSGALHLRTGSLNQNSISAYIPR